GIVPAFVNNPRLSSRRSEGEIRSRIPLKVYDIGNPRVMALVDRLCHASAPVFCFLTYLRFCLGASCAGTTATGVGTLSVWATGIFTSGLATTTGGGDSRSIQL